MAQSEKIEISNLTRETIVNTLVEPYYKDMVKTTIHGKNFWRILGISLETSSKIMVAFGSILSFSAGFYQDDTLSFVAGSISCMSLALLQIASFSYKENKKQGEELNILLKKLNLDTVPSMVRSEDQTTVVATARYASPPVQRYTNNNANPYSQPYQHQIHEKQLYEQQLYEKQLYEQEIHDLVEELKKKEVQLHEMQIRQQKENEIHDNEYKKFIESTVLTHTELQKLNQELDEKLTNVNEREERIKEKEKELNLHHNDIQRSVSLSSLNSFFIYTDEDLYIFLLLFLFLDLKKRENKNKN